MLLGGRDGGDNIFIYIREIIVKVHRHIVYITHTMNILYAIEITNANVTDTDIPTAITIYKHYGISARDTRYYREFMCINQQYYLWKLLYDKRLLEGPVRIIEQTDDIDAILSLIDDELY
jgi:hypothetical protein